MGDVIYLEKYLKKMTVRCPFCKNIWEISMRENITECERCNTIYFYGDEKQPNDDLK